MVCCLKIKQNKIQDSISGGRDVCTGGCVWGVRVVAGLSPNGLLKLS